MKKTLINQTVMVFGTFDVLHPGHLNFLRQAKKFGKKLVVSVSRDKNAMRFKGRAPIFSERERLELVQSLAIVDKAVLGNTGNYLPHTLKERPDVIALGYDQTAYETHLRQDIAAGKLRVSLVRLKPYRISRYKSSLFKNRIHAAHNP